MGQVAGVASVRSYVLRGVTPVPVTVRAEVLKGELPGMTFEGMHDVEARSRVRCAMRAMGYEVPRALVRVTAEPLWLRKIDEGLDLPIAVAVLIASGQVPTAVAQILAFAGALGLDGRVLPVRGTVAMAKAARGEGLRLACGEGSRALGLPGTISVEALDWSGFSAAERLPEGLSTAIREAAERRHGVLLVGDKGRVRDLCGIVARALSEALPKMDAEQREEVAAIHDAAGLDAPVGRPVICPPQEASLAALVGGGRPVMPGAATLAANGVLNLGDLRERGERCLDVLAEARAEGKVTLVRVDGMVTMPASFLPVAFCPSGGEKVRGFAEATSERLGMDLVSV